MKSKWTLGRKLGVSFGALIVLLLGLGWSSVSMVDTLQTTLQLSGSTSARSVELAGMLLAFSSDMQSAERGMILAATVKDSAAVDELDRLFQERAGELKTALQDLKSLAVPAETKSALADLNRAVDDWKTSFAEVYGLVHGGNLEKATQMVVGEDDRLFHDFRSRCDHIRELQRQLVARDVARGNAVSSTAFTVAIVFSLLALLVGAAVAVVIRQVVGMMRGFASRLAGGAAEVAEAAAELSSSGRSLAQGASQQAASLEETSASSEQIAAMTERNAVNSEEAARLMAATAASVEGANRKMEEMVRSMGEITASSDKISKIIKVIDEIAFQTNILALNAAVEAARAGEAGMGFAVVADEVRSLAQRCAQAAQDTAQLIEESISRSSQGSHRLSEVSGSIHAITEQSSKAKLLVEEIHSGSREQSRGISQVSTAVARMQRATQSEATTAEQSAANGLTLSVQAEAMRQLVAELNQFVGKSGALIRSGSRSSGQHPEATVPQDGPKLSRPSAAALPSAAKYEETFPLDEQLK